MLPIPRILTVDPTGTVARMVRAALELLERPVILVDVPGKLEALAELNQGGYHVVVTAAALDDGMGGMDLALHVKQTLSGCAVMAVLDEGGADIDDNALENLPYVCLRRPVNAAHFMHLFDAALTGQDILALHTTPAAPTLHSNGRLGPVPRLDISVAQRTVDTLLTDVGAMAIILVDRNGQVMLERGAVGYLNREQLAAILLPTMTTTIDMQGLVGGSKISSLQFFDGQTYDVFVLTVGLNYFLCLVFDGQVGGRQFGAVTRFGRRAAEDLIAPMGEAAYKLAPAQPVVEERPRRPKTGILKPPPEPVQQDVIEPAAVRAESWEPAPEPPEEPVKLEPIENLDLGLFDPKQLQQLDMSQVDDLFDPDRLAQIANETRRERGPLTYDEARELGIIP
jgi:CheY-like chemotaxis protein